MGLFDFLKKNKKLEFPKLEEYVKPATTNIEETSQTTTMNQENNPLTEQEITTEGMNNQNMMINQMINQESRTNTNEITAPETNILGTNNKDPLSDIESIRRREANILSQEMIKEEQEKETTNNEITINKEEKGPVEEEQKEETQKEETIPRIEEEIEEPATTEEEDEHRVIIEKEGKLDIYVEKEKYKEVLRNSKEIIKEIKKAEEESQKLLINNDKIITTLANIRKEVNESQEKLLIIEQKFFSGDNQ